MTPKEFRDRLQRMDKQLDRIRQQLIRCEPLDVQFVPLLESVVGILKDISNQGENALADQSLQKTLKSIRARAVRVKTLLDSAANFYGDVSCWPGTVLSYSSDGRFVPVEFRKHISVQA